MSDKKIPAIIRKIGMIPDILSSHHDRREKDTACHFCPDCHVEHDKSHHMAAHPPPDIFHDIPPSDIQFATLRILWSDMRRRTAGVRLYACGGNRSDSDRRCLARFLEISAGRRFARKGETPAGGRELVP